MKKILFLADINSSHTQKWVSGAASLGYSTAIFSLSKPVNDWYKKARVELLSDNGVVENNIFTGNDLSKIRYIKFIGEINKSIKKFSPDIIHSHYATSYGLLGAMTGKHPFILSVWGSDVFDFPKHSFLNRLMLKWIFKKSDLLLSTSLIMKKEIGKYSSGNVVVTPFGIDTNQFCKNKLIRSDVFTIGIIKSLETHYGIDYLINAFEIVVRKYPFKKLRLVICGQGTKSDEYKKLVTELKLNQQVSFTGKIPYEEVPAMHNTFNLFVCPSLNESFGVSVLEASACEVPVIASNVGGLPEVVADGESGILVKPGNTKEIADAISYFIDNPEMQERFGKAGRRFVIDNFDWSKSLVQINDIYHHF